MAKKPRKPTIRGLVLRYPHPDAPNDSDRDLFLIIDSDPWYNWLKKNDKFKFVGMDAHFHARKETVDSRGYWYGYLWRHKRLYKRYIGKTEDLSYPRLDKICKVFKKIKEGAK